MRQATSPRAERRARATQGPLRGPTKPARIPSGDRRTYSFDEAAFVRRFKGDANRLAQRRDAWRVLAVALGTTPVFINSDASSDEGTAHGAAVAMRRPVNAA